LNKNSLNELFFLLKNKKKCDIVLKKLHKVKTISFMKEGDVDEYTSSKEK